MKNKIVYTISTPYRDYYELDADGCVVKYSNGLDKTDAKKSELKSWQVVGIREIKPFNNLGRLIPLKEAVKIKDLFFKNGNPRYTIQDLDHGTTRIVGNWNVHGVASIRAV